MVKKTVRRAAGARAGKQAARPNGRRAPRSGPIRGARVLRAADLMSREPITVREDMSIADLCDLFQEKNINGAPVVDHLGRLVGVVAQDDIIYGAMGHPDRAEPEPKPGGVPKPGGRAAESPGQRRGRRVVQMLRERTLRGVPEVAPRPGEKPFWADQRAASDPLRMPVSAIMTSPAISAEETTPVTDLCNVMWNLRIHRVPIVSGGRVTGLVSSMDLCRAILSGLIKV
jgi:CBS domain-containing protein